MYLQPGSDSHRDAQQRGRGLPRQQQGGQAAPLWADALS